MDRSGAGGGRGGRGGRRGGGGEEEERRTRQEEEEATDIKSNNPHLAGGEKAVGFMDVNISVVDVPLF